MKKREHDVVRDIVWRHLLRRGHRIAKEVGVHNGRIDLIRIDPDGSWAELYEVKVSSFQSGITQLLRYGRGLKPRPRLTLVIPSRSMDDNIKAAAKASGVRIWEFDTETHRFNHSLGPGRIVSLPYLSDDALDRIITGIAKWNGTPAALLARKRAALWSQNSPVKVAA